MRKRFQYIGQLLGLRYFSFVEIDSDGRNRHHHFSWDGDKTITRVGLAHLGALAAKRVGRDNEILPSITSSTTEEEAFSVLNQLCSQFPFIGGFDDMVYGDDKLVLFHNRKA